MSDSNGSPDHALTRAAQAAALRASVLGLYARQWLDRESASDVVQQALMALLSQRVCPDDPIAWIYRAVRNAAIDQLRSDGRRRRREQQAARQEWFAAAPDAGVNAKAAQRALEQLPRELREIVVLRIWGELGFAEIARIAEISVGTAHQRFTEAVRVLRGVLE